MEGCGLSGASEDEDECVSSPAASTYEDSADIIKNAMSDEVTKQLAAAGKQYFLLSKNDFLKPFSLCLKMVSFSNISRQP